MAWIHIDHRSVQQQHIIGVIVENNEKSGWYVRLIVTYGNDTRFMIRNLTYEQALELSQKICDHIESGTTLDLRTVKM